MNCFHMGMHRLAFLLLAAGLGVAVPANAGPPLICHAISIGSATSLPWTGDGRGWSGDASYDVNHLVRDTLAILDSNPGVLVRMETLRRATIYARRDPRVAKELLTRLYSRASRADITGKPDPLAWFDAGYLVECYKEWMGQNLPHMTDGLPLDPNPAAGLDGYAWVEKAIGLRGQDAEMEFAAALITLEGSPANHRVHVERALAGAKTDALLAGNLASHFIGEKGETMAEMLVKVT
ncbi:MAG TPA: hypothetical protein VL523_13325, partial [Terriglobia bacterium]|nr:hypothetical protein [Terriglobia bacterium]